MRAGLLLILAVGCGGSAKPVTTPPPVAHGSAASPAPPVVAAAAAPAPAAVCKRMMELKAQRCGSFADLPFDEPQCVSELAKPGDDPALIAFVGCVVQPSCEEVKNCLTAASQQAAEQQTQELRACKDTVNSFKAVGLPAAEWNNRNGASVTKYANAKSTRDLPIEMCGVRDENTWLVSLACNDGSHPIMDAETARIGNVGTGGRCGSIIDKYAVKCPEKTYDIFIDAYVCATK